MWRCKDDCESNLLLPVSIIITSEGLTRSTDASCNRCRILDLWGNSQADVRKFRSKFKIMMNVKFSVLIEKISNWGYASNVFHSTSFLEVPGWNQVISCDHQYQSPMSLVWHQLEHRCIVISQLLPSTSKWHNSPNLYIVVINLIFMDQLHNYLHTLCSDHIMTICVKMFYWFDSSEKALKILYRFSTRK